MKRLLILFVIVVSFTSLSFGQTDEKKSKRPNFSGVWLLDLDRVNDRYNQEVDDQVRQEYEKQKLTLKITVVLKIVHNDPEMIITGARLKEVFDESGKLVERVPTEIPQVTLYTDRRRENSSPDKKHAANARSRWDGNTIVREVPLWLQKPALLNEVSPHPPNRRTAYSLEKKNKELVIEEYYEGVGLQSNRSGPSNKTRLVYTLMEQQDQ